MLKDLIEGFSSLVFPPHCTLCRTHTRSISLDPVCPACAQLLLKNAPPLCLKCSRHLRRPVHSLCPSCRHSEPAFDFAWSAFIYNEPLKELIHLFKYYQRTSLRRYFGALMAAFVKDLSLDIRQFDMVTAIPLFPSKLRERGFNQSHLLAQEIAGIFSLPYHPRLLIKARSTKNQADLSLKERWTNIEGAFKIRHPLSLKNKNILIIDDLLTTGATAAQAALTLKKGGAATVGVLTLAITP